MDLLAVGAHPDDVELFAGGLMALSLDRGYEVGILHLTRGEAGTRGSADERREEALAACEALGVPPANMEILDLGDGRLADDPERRREVIAVLRRRRPRMVVHHHSVDAHPDHIAAHAIMRGACAQAHLRTIETDAPPFRCAARLEYLNFRSLGVLPSLVVDVTDVFERKMAAIGAYRSQFYNPEYEAVETRISTRDFYDQIEARARYFGGMVGARFGEPFFSPAPLGLADPLAALTPRD